MLCAVKLQTMAGVMATALLVAACSLPASAYEVTAPAGAEAPPMGEAPPMAAAMPVLEKEAPASTREAMCLLVESAANSHGLPTEFFARVIWQESRFQAGAVGPVTRSGERAQGIAQFMPGTANERALLNPFDPVQALPKSAEFLSELRARFGNLGLAAAAYNAGPRRVQDWLDGRGAMPMETRNYVSAITGTTVDEWAAQRAARETKTVNGTKSCRELIALLRQAPNRFVAQLERRVKQGEAQPWGVQLAAGFSRAHALTMYARAMKQLSSVIGNRDPMILTTLLRSRGTRTFYQVRIGADKREAANDVCSRIRREGQACLVLRTRGGRA